jgi:hypothetical protein
MKKRSRNWILTNNYKDEEPINDKELLEYIQNITGLVYTAFQLEQGENGTKHHQIYISFENAKSFDTIKKHFSKAHIEPVKGTPQQASDYCTKQETRISMAQIYGEIPQQGKRNDMKDIYQMITDGATRKDIREAYPSQYLRYKNKIESVIDELREEKFKNVFRQLEVRYLVDSPGVGKTRYIMEKYGYENVYRVSNYKNPFDSYNGEDVIIFEEFRSSLPIEQMLNFLDGYPLRLPARYNDKVACYTQVYIVSNWDYYQQYEKVRETHLTTAQALDRRISIMGDLETIKKYDNELEEIRNLF